MSDTGVTATASARWNTGSAGWLEDHRVEGHGVVPGAVHVALVLDHVRSGSNPLGAAVLFDLRFGSMLSTDSAVGLDVRRLSDQSDGDGSHIEIVSDEPRAPCYATLKIAGDRLTAETMREFIGDRPPTSGSAEVWQPADDVYRRFDHDGNGYGPHFRSIVKDQLDARMSISRVELPAGTAASELDAPHPILLDAGIQCLARCRPENSGPFVLASIDRLAWTGIVSNGGTAVAEVEKCNDEELFGTVRLYDEAGALVAAMDGVRLRSLDPNRASASIGVSATFTAEPIGEVLEYWGEQLGRPVRADFAPYGQLFQSLLDPTSSLAGDHDATVSLIRFEDLLSVVEKQERPPKNTGSTAAPVDETDDALSTHRLPNDLEVFHLNEYETEYLHQEIFVDGAYLRHGVTISDGDTVLDIGANIGLFAIFAVLQADNVRCYAVEPSPIVHPLLAANARRFGGITPVEAGAGEKSGTATFTSYARSSVFSGFAADADVDRRALEAIVRNQLAATTAVDAAVDDLIEDLLADRLEAQQFDCRIVSVSELIREHELTTIDLLKVDAEKSELAILDGIDPEHWAMIGQVVVEVHDAVGDQVAAVIERLQQLGFDVVADTEDLLERSGLHNVYAVRPERRRRGSALAAASLESLENTVDELVDATTSFASGRPQPHLVMVAPRSPGGLGTDGGRVQQQLEERLSTGLAQLPSVSMVGSEELVRGYEVDQWFDPVTHRLGHIPYTPEAFAAMGTASFRRLSRSWRKPTKVIVVDADNTLWSGVAGEDGPDNVVMTPGHRHLQELLVDRVRRGMLVCICSRNNPDDVHAALSRGDMPLGREQVVTERINWEPKSVNIRSIAAELDLGLDSFVFLDDSVIECAAVRSDLPDLLTLQVPSVDAEIQRFVENLWVLDATGPGTDEDSRRTQLYQRETARSEARNEAPSLADFIDSLGLVVTIADLDPEAIDRAAQLTQRTNQFTTTTERHDVASLTAAMNDACHGVEVRVTDRFGDYGVVGLALWRHTGQSLIVDSLLLSCRVLGRGVEHAVIAWLGRHAQESDSDDLMIRFRQSDRNEPVHRFLTSLAEQGDEGFRLGAKAAADLIFRPADNSSNPADSTVGPAGNTFSPADNAPVSAEDGKARASRIDARDWSIQERIAGDLADMTVLVDELRCRRVRPRPDSLGSAVAPTTELQERMVRIWADLLGYESVGVQDHFFDLGGRSLHGVELVARLNRELSLTLSVVDLFDGSTVASLCALASGDGPADDGVARERGTTRRERRAGRRDRSRR